MEEVEAQKVANKFPSAISRYLVSNVGWNTTVFRLTWFPSAISRYLVSNWWLHHRWRKLFPFPSAISRYLVSNLNQIRGNVHNILFPSAISRYLVSNNSALVWRISDPKVSIRYIAVLGFQPWTHSLAMRITIVSIRYIAVLGFQLSVQEGQVLRSWSVSIRYIAVLGFQQASAKTSYRKATKFPSAISRYLVSNGQVPDFTWNFPDGVSIRYIAVLGFQRGHKQLPT